jgi:hypothetical protein
MKLIFISEIFKQKNLYFKTDTKDLCIKDYNTKITSRFYVSIKFVPKSLFLEKSLVKINQASADFNINQMNLIFKFLVC